MISFFAASIMRLIQNKSKAKNLKHFGYYAFPPIAAIVLFGILSFLSLQSVRRSAAATAKAHQAVATVRSLVRDLVNAETGQRGYLLTGQAEYLEPFHSARGLILQDVAEVHAISIDLDVAMPLRDLDGQIHERIEQLDKTVALKMDGKSPDAINFLATGVGRKTMDQIRQLTAQMEDILRSKITKSDNEASNAYFIAIATGATSLVLALAAGLWSMFRLERELQRRRTGEELIRQRAGQLQSLADIIARVVAARDVDSIVGIALNEFRQLIGAREALIQFKSSDKVRVERGIVATGIQKPSAEYLSCIFNIINFVAKGESSFSRNRCELVADADMIATHAWSVCGDAMDGILSAPIWDRSRNEIGRIVLMGKFGDDFNSNDVSIASQLAYTVSVAIENARLTNNVNDEARRKDEFLAMLGHELRNPLASVLTGCEALQLIERSQQGAPLFESIHRQSMLMSHIVDDLLDVSRIGQSKIILNRTRFAIIETIEHLVDDYRRMYPKRTILFDKSSITSKLAINGDKTRIIQSIANLLHNAFKFSQGENPIEVLVARVLKTNDKICISIVDSGIGLDARELEEIFLLFHQSNATIDRSQGGLGIGLTLAKGLIEMHGGTIRVESQGRGHGSTFTIELPLAEPINAEESGPKPISTEVDGLHAKKRYRVLAIDDRMDALLPLKVLITKDGHEFAEARDGPTGLEKAADFLPDIVLCDIGLPGELNGLDVARSIRSDANLKNVYLVALSGYSQPSDLAKSADAGFDFHVAKPIKAHVLSDLIHSRPTFLGKRQTVEESDSVRATSL
jgi:signal transduction histidine kinase/CHASE3 domain sensor protein/CheY-like chemotaxis protein